MIKLRNLFSKRNRKSCCIIIWFLFLKDTLFIREPQKMVINFRSYFLNNSWLIYDKDTGFDWGGKKSSSNALANEEG